MMPGFARSPLFILCLASLAAAMANRSMDPLVAAIGRDFNVSIATAALVISAYALPYAFVQPILGPVGDYYGKARLLRICSWVLCISLAVTVISPTFIVLLFARFIGGLASGGIMPIAMASVGDRYPPAERQQAIATYVSVAIIGFTFSSAAAGILAVYLSWRTIFAVTLVIAIATALLMRHLHEEAPPPDKPMQFSNVTSGYKLLFSNPRSFVCYIAVLLEGIALWGMLPFIAPLLLERSRGGTGEAGLIITALGLGSLLFTGMVKYWLRMMTRYQLMFAGGFVTAIGPLSMAFDLHWLWFALTFFISGFGFFMVHNSLQGEVAELAPSIRGSAFSMHSCFLFIGHSLGPICFAIGLATIGDVAILTAFAALLMVIGPACSILFNRLKPSPEFRE